MTALGTAAQARGYALNHARLEPGWRVLDIGPGRFPLSGSGDIWHLDCDPAMLAGLSPDRCIIADLDRLPLPLRDREFDFVWCSHVIEHVADPVAVAAELARIAPRGLLVAPHAFKDALFNFEDPTHRWWCFPPAAPGGALRVMPVEVARVSALYDAELRAALGRLYRTEPQRSCDHATLKHWVDTHEHDLDVIMPWAGELRVEVIR